ncbi:GNAT family N-acetyltransferase [Candidatus Woesearchaeota archaeon]|nr:GNAT family N-acetyltransferase [Candidatus Woesearchaeota archaeon]
MKIRIKEVEKSLIEEFSKGLWREFADESGMLLDEESFCFVVHNKDEEIGYLHIKVTLGVAYLEDMILKSEFRNKKIGHQMMEFFENFAENKGCHKMRIKTCPETNQAAYHLYKKFGFKQEAILKNDYFNKDWVILSKYTKHKQEKSESK